MNEDGARIVPIAAEFIEGFHSCLDAVARERRYLGFLEAPPLERVRAFVETNIAENLPQFVAVLGGRVVGWCDISPETLPGFTHVGRLGMGVHADFRGRGIGSRLLKATLEKARAIGLERVELEVYASNTVAIALYERAGFAREGLKARGRKTDEGYDDVVQMGLLFPVS